jgi:hypothetical protein
MSRARDPMATMACAMSFFGMALLLAPSWVASAQATKSSIDTGFFRLDLSIPDIPAASVTDVDPSKAGTPGSTRALATAFSGFGDSLGNFKLPKTFAVEFAPRLLFLGRGLSVKQYEENIPWSTLRVSAATSRVNDSTGATRIGAGIRTNFIDQSDPRANKQYQSNVDPYLIVLAQKTSELRVLVWGDTIVGEVNDIFIPSAGDQKPDPKKVHALRTEIAQTLKILDSLKSDLADNGWRAMKLELAGAFAVRSKDEFAKSPRADAYAAWTGFSFPLMPATGGVLVGRVQRVRDTTQTESPFANQAVGAGRFLFGGRYARAFAEWQYTRQGGESGRAWTTGGELRLTKDLWIRLSTGIETPVGADKGKLVTTFKVNGAPPVAEAANK